MHVRWAESAAADLETIALYLAERTPIHAERLVQAIYRAPEMLLRMPHLGRPGRKSGTRELVLAPLPWILVYQVNEDNIEVVRVLHGARKWP